MPFHAWAPDVYQGAPSPFVAFLSVAPKAASAVVLARLVMLVTSAPTAGDWTKLVSVLAIASMLVGNLFALAQRDIKRMLAYSGIAHMGYLLIPLASPGRVELAADARLSRLLHPDERRRVRARFDALRQARRAARDRQPLRLGLPLPRRGRLHGGLHALPGRAFRRPRDSSRKYLVFAHAIQHGNLGLALVGIFASLIGVVFYLRVIYMLYMRDEIASPGA